ncbi:MAG TPA: hypothetical protein VND91_06270 [Candidatus Saccharimonadia bacterium]|nr:hypothetical protein [Candidatus Saccharimonadia bacterium]
MLNQSKILATAVALLFAGGASANTLLVTQGGASGNAGLVALDFQSNGDVSAFQFTVDLPKGIASIDTSKCLSELPKGFTGVCRSKGNRVAAVVYSGNTTTFPSDVVSLGTISYNGSIAKDAGGIVVGNMVASTPSGAESPGMKSDVSFDDGARGTHEK